MTAPLPQLETIACPICGGEDFAPTAGEPEDGRQWRSTWAICRGCGLVFQNPRLARAPTERLYSEHEYHAHNDAQLPETLAYALQRPAPLMAYIDEHVPGLREPGTMIDVGCGLGGAVLRYKLRGWRALGAEPDPALAEVAAGLGLDVRTEFFTERTFAGTNADLVYTCHSFEHFLDPLAVAEAAWTALADGGILFVCVPTFRRSRQPGRAWMNAAHTFLFTHVSLGNICRRAGFLPLAHRYHGAEGELWLLARKVDPKPASPRPEREDWRSIERELGVAVPARAAAWAPSRWLSRNAHHLGTLVLDPAEFGRKAWSRLRRRTAAESGVEGRTT